MTNYLKPVQDRLDHFSDYLESIEAFFQEEDYKLDNWIQSLKENNLKKFRNHLTHKGLRLEKTGKNYKHLMKFILDDPNLQMGEGYEPSFYDTDLSPEEKTDS